MRSIRLVSPDGSTEATFAPEANLLCCSLQYHGEELLDQGRGTQMYADRGKTMGVPLLHPWANRLAGHHYEAASRSVTLPEGDPRVPVDPNGLPIHGALPRLLRWEADGGGDAEAGDSLQASLQWNAAELLELFPYPHELRVHASVAAGELTITTSISATAGQQVPVCFGYHPYLRLPGVAREAWQVSLGVTRRLLLDDRMIPTGEREPLERRAFALAERALDDGFDALAEPPVFAITAGEQQLALRFLHGYGFAQVYAPPGKNFICFEPMTAPTNALNSGDGLHVISPGETHEAAFRIEYSVG